jgi:hypothetical protein
MTMRESAYKRRIFHNYLNSYRHTQGIHAMKISRNKLKRLIKEELNRDTQNRGEVSSQKDEDRNSPHQEIQMPEFWNQILGDCLSERRNRQTEKERLEALVTESPETRVLGEAPVRGSLQGAKSIAQSRARVKLAEITGKSNISARQIDGALEDDVFYAVMELQ